MKKLFTILLLLICFNSYSTNYYFSSSGNDISGTGTIGAPWASIAKFNSIFASKSPGDNFLFNRGDVFYGKMIISRSGSSGLPITIGAYGTGALPIITGFTTANSWSNLGSNIWETSSAISTLPYTNMVTVNGVNVAMGRTPNAGTYYTYQSHVQSAPGATSTLTSSSLNSAATNWTGAEVAWFNLTYSILRNNISSMPNATTLAWTRLASDGGVQMDGQGFIIQNDARTLDAQNEWYYNPSTKKLRIYSTSSPTGVQVSTVDTLVTINGFDYITFDNISFTGSNKKTFCLSSSATNITIQNCNLDFAGKDGIFVGSGGNSSFLKVENCIINHCNSSGIATFSSANNPTIRLNTIKNCGKQMGMGTNLLPGETPAKYQAVYTAGSNALIEYNRVDSSGYNGIDFYGTNSIIQYNYITNCLLLLHDGGGVYTWNPDTTVHQTGSKVRYNIIGNIPQDEGVYLDDKTNGVEISNNSIFNCNEGIYLHNDFKISTKNNTVFDCNKALHYYPSDSQVIPYGDSLKNNIFFAKTSTQHAAGFYHLTGVPSVFIADSNYYARPIDDNQTIDDNVSIVYTLAGYKSAVSPQESHSQKSPVTISDVNDLRFEFNATSSPLTVALDAIYEDIKGNVYSEGGITLQPYTSAVLIRTGSLGNIPPSANAGTDQSITLPTSSVILSGSGADADGSIASYSWTQISGPNTATIVSSSSASTSVTGLVAGTYVFQLTATDNLGSTGSDAIQVTVVPAGNISPSANAGPDQSITAANTTLSGSGSDPDGTIASYNWVKVSGPGIPIITNPPSQNPVISNLQVGTYIFRLTVTDNLGATTTDDVQVIVSSIPVNTGSATISNATFTSNWWYDYLKWTTSGESNVSYYRIEKNTTGSFKAVTQVVAKGNGSYTYRLIRHGTRPTYRIVPIFRNNISGAATNFQ